MRYLLFYVVVLCISCSSDTDSIDDIEVYFELTNQEGLVSSTFLEDESVYLKVTVANKSEFTISYEVGTFINPQNFEVRNNENVQIDIISNINSSFDIRSIAGADTLNFWIPLKNVNWDQSNPYFNTDFIPTLSDDILRGTFKIEMNRAYSYTLLGEKRISREFELSTDFSIN